MSRRRVTVRSCLISAVLVVAAGCSTSGSNDAADQSPATAAPMSTTTASTATTTTEAATTTTRPTTTTTEAEFPAEDEYLVTFFEDCQSGSDEACDFLFLVSEVDSEYEEVSNTCGGRGDGIEFCTPGLELVDGIADAGSPTVQTLAADCQSGSSMHACDLLYLVSETDSEEEAIGNTCGGRIPDGAVPACTIELGVAVGP